MAYIKKEKKDVKIARKPRKPRARLSPKFVDTKYLGQEPTPMTITNSADTEFARAMAWYNYFFDADECQKWLVEHMEAKGYPKTQITAIRRASTWKVPRTIGTLAKMMDAGWVLPEDVVERFGQRIKKALAAIGDTGADVIEVAKKPKPTLAQATLAKAVTFTGEVLDTHIDRFYQDNTVESTFYNELQTAKPSAVACNLMRTKLIELIAELDMEGYEHLKPKAKKAQRTYFEALQSDLDRFAFNKKATKVRKPRVKKEKPVEKVVSSVKYQVEYAPLKLVSISPQSIVKATSLWVFNTKYKTLTVFHAESEKGLSIKGTTITGFDAKTSVTKRLGRGADKVLKTVLTGGKIAVRKIMSEDLAKASAMVAKGRLNENTILLRSYNG